MATTLTTYFAFLIAFSYFCNSEMMQDKIGGQSSSFLLCQKVVTLDSYVLFFCV